MLNFSDFIKAVLNAQNIPHVLVTYLSADLKTRVIMQSSYEFICALFTIGFAFINDDLKCTNRPHFNHKTLYHTS